MHTDTPSGTRVYTKERSWNGQQNKNHWRAYLTVPTSPLVLMWIKTHIHLVRAEDPKFIHALSPIIDKSKYKR